MKMKKAGSSKSISSPGRTDKFPPPLMRFLRSNVGSKSSRGRTTTRASPMMFLRKNKNHVAIETTQEPSSPKVTCIGQVRTRRSSKEARNCNTRRSISVRKQEKQVTSKKSLCCCCNFRMKLHNNPKSLFLAFKKVMCCFQFQQCGKKVETVDSSSRIESTQRIQSHRVSTSSNESIDNVVVCSISNPPKDALILTRCRSAPYRSSSLASRLWGSPLNHTSSDTSPKSQSPQKYYQELEEEEEEEEEVEKPLPVLENPILPEGENGVLEARKSYESEEMESKGEEKNGEGAYVHPLLLTRCKSEPARTGERLNPRRFNELESQS